MAAAKKKKKKIITPFAATADPVAPPVPGTTATVKKRTKEEIDEEKDRANRLVALTAGISKQYSGRAVLMQGKDISNTFMLRRPTGIIGLDLRLGGGFPAGGLSQVIGKESSGKSFVVNKTIANCQSIYGKDTAISICMTEMPWDKSFAKWWCDVRVAFNEQEIATLNAIRKRYGQEPYSAEYNSWFNDQVGVIQETRAANAEILLEIACQHVESNLYQIVMIDSFGALLTKAEEEAEKGLEDKHRGGASMVITQFMHRLHAALNLPDKYGKPNTTSVIGINQYRSNVNAGMYGNPMNVAGGYALRHGKLVDLHLETGKRYFHDVNGSKVIVGKEINWEVLKGKAGCHDGPKGSYNFYFNEYGYPKGIDIVTDLMATALQLGVMQQNGAWYYYKNEALGQGEVNAAKTVSGNPSLLAMMRDECYARAGLNFIVREE